MAQLLDIFAFVSVLLRGLTLAFEALTIGGVIFLMAIVRNDNDIGSQSARRLSRFTTAFAASLAATQAVFVAANSAILMNSAGLTWAGVRGAGFSIAGAFMIGGAALVGGFVRTRFRKLACPAGCILILCGAVMTSHSVGRLEHRGALACLTLAHHLATAAWIGAMPYLLWTLREKPGEGASQYVIATITSRFSRMAMISVAVLAGAGVAMAMLYVGSPSALVGTTYGIMLLSKVTLTGLLVLLGALNFRIVRAVRVSVPAILLPLRRFGEAEVGIGFTVILAAASLTSIPPAIDVTVGRVTIPEIAQRVKPAWPRMHTPPLKDLLPATPLTASVASSLVPGQSIRPSSPADIAWSEYNHHWAGLVVLAIGVLSLLAQRIPWARHWPLLFLGLAVFLFLRADAENWPLGPRGFWESFQVAEVAQHRVFVLLIIAFGVFEWAVRTARFPADPGSLIFPLVCAIGGALLLTHSHSLGNVKEEFLAELSHTPLAILAVVAGWARWLEIRLSGDRPPLLAQMWQIGFILIGAILLNYRES